MQPMTRVVDNVNAVCVVYVFVELVIKMLQCVYTVQQSILYTGRNEENIL